MGYRRLKAILKSKRIFVRDLAKETGVDLTKLYNSMAIKDNCNLSQPEKEAVYGFLVAKGVTRLSLEEVFETDADDRYEFDTVYKSEAVARSKRTVTHKR